MTGETKGYVDGYYAMVWRDRDVTCGIAVIGASDEGGTFASEGDNGSLVMYEDEHGVLWAAGMLIGKNTPAMI